MEFDPAHRKWQCCFCHLTSGVTIFAGLELVVGSVFAVAFFSGSFGEAPWIFPPIGISVGVDATICVLTAFLLIVAVRRVKGKLAIPHLVVHTLSILVVLGAAVGSLLTEGDGTQREEVGSYRLTVTIVLSCIVIAVLIYAVYIVQRAYHYLNSLHKHHNRRWSVALHLIETTEGPGSRRPSSRMS